MTGLMPGAGQVSFAAELETAVRAARTGAAEVERVYRSVDFDARAKSDGSPVTVADLASDAAIRAVITADFPGDGLLTEEGSDDPARLAMSRVWIADPLDGTREFVARNDDFDVFVALTVDGRPVVAVSCHPPTGHTIYAVEGQGAWWQAGEGDEPKRVTFGPVAHAPRVFTSPYFGAPATVPKLEAALAGIPVDHVAVIGPGFHARHFVPAGGGQPEFDVFIAGVFDDWLSGGEWDGAIADLIVREAGGAFSDLWGEPLRYNKPIARNEYGYVASVDPRLHLEVLAALSAYRPADKPELS